MSFYIRFLDQKRHWDKESLNESWLQNGEIPSDALRNLKTENNSFSIYYLDNELVVLSKVLSAYAVTRDYLAQIDYSVFSAEIIESLEISIEEVPGDTSVDEVNALHRDVVNISAARLVNMAKKLIDEGNLCRITKTKVKGLIKKEIDNGTIELNKVKESIRSKLDV